MASSDPHRRPTVSVVIPTRNEARNISFVLRALPAGIDEVILVDGNSVDGTVGRAVRARPDLRILRQGRRGKGNALAAGFAAATGDYIVMIDADGSMDPAEIPLFVKALDDGADYAKGTRFALGGGSDDISRLRDVGNKFLNAITNLIFRTRYSDLCYGYNAFRKECLAAFALPNPDDTHGGAQWGDGFEIETMINVRIAKAKMRVQEVPSFEHPRRRKQPTNLSRRHQGAAHHPAGMRRRHRVGHRADPDRGRLCVPVASPRRPGGSWWHSRADDPHPEDPRPITITDSVSCAGKCDGPGYAYTGQS